jgi:RNA polymerase sigma-70 factor, ECF subfamily
MPFRPSDRPEDSRRLGDTTHRATDHGEGDLRDPGASSDSPDEIETPENEQVADSDEDLALDPAMEEEDDVEEAQRFAESGVKKDMATAAVHPQTHAGIGSPAPDVTTLPPGGWSQISDAEIMLRVAAGDEAGFGILVEKYRRQMLHYMYRMVHNQAVAEELAQEVFLRVYRARASYRAEAKFSTWLYRIATNLGVNHARDTRHERGAQAVYLDQTDPETGTTPDVADTTPSVEQDMLRQARLAAIRKHVMALPERQRTAVLMHKYQDLDYKQIGAVLKLSESATKSLLFRAYQTLRERLKEFV